MTNFDFKTFFTKFRKIIVACGVCVLAVAIITAVALNSGGIFDDFKDKNDNLNTVNNPTITFVLPVANGEIIKDFSNTALQYNSTLKQWEAHKAVDIKGPDNADVFAAYGGEVVSIETTYLKGTTITIRHNKDLQTVYSSLAPNPSVAVGAIVKKGDVIGKISDSAKNESKEGQHLHFEVLLKNVKVDPNTYLTTSEK